MVWRLRERVLVSRARGVVVFENGADRLVVAFGWLSIPQTGKLCLVMDDDFSNGIDPAHWTHEVRLDGFG